MQIWQRSREGKERKGRRHETVDQKLPTQNISWPFRVNSLLSQSRVKCISSTGPDPQNQSRERIGRLLGEVRAEFAHRRWQFEAAPCGNRKDPMIMIKVQVVSTRSRWSSLAQLQKVIWVRTNVTMKILQWSRWWLLLKGVSRLYSSGKEEGILPTGELQRLVRVKLFDEPPESHEYGNSATPMVIGALVLLYWINCASLIDVLVDAWTFTFCRNLQWLLSVLTQHKTKSNPIVSKSQSIEKLSRQWKFEAKSCDLFAFFLCGVFGFLFAFQNWKSRLFQSSQYNKKMDWWLELWQNYVIADKTVLNANMIPAIYYTRKVIISVK